MSHDLNAEDFDGRMVEIVSGDMPGYVGEALEEDHGWLSVHLDALDPEDTRVLYPVYPSDVVLRKDLE